jgi:cytochrome c6
MRKTRFKVALLTIGLLTLSLVISPFMSIAQQATSEPVLEDELLERGEIIFANVCAACHQPGGEGVEGAFPALAGNPLVTLEDPTVVTHVVLYGRGGMPRFNTAYNDEDIAAVVSYVRGGLAENDADPITPEFVAELREEVEGAVPEEVEEEEEATPVAQEGQEPSDEAVGEDEEEEEMEQ